MPLAAYSPDNPAAVDPWPIEQTLAPIALGGDQMQAQGMLDSYRLQRQAASNLYGEDLTQQHQFAYTQLAQQMAEARLKEFPNIAKLPGGAQFIAQGGIPGMDMGGNSDALTNLALAGNRAQAATDFEHAGAGLASTVAAGYPPSAQQASIATGGFSGPQGDPTAIGVAKLKLQGDLARAAASGAAAGPRESMEIPNAYGGKSTLSFPAKMTDQQKRDYLTSKGVLPADAPPPNAPIPSGSVGAAPPATGLVLNPQRGKQAASGPPQNAQAGADAARQAVLANQDKLPRLFGPQAAADIQAGIKANGGKPNVQPDTTKRSGWAVVGASGKHY